MLEESWQEKLSTGVIPPYCRSNKPQNNELVQDESVAEIHIILLRDSQPKF